MKTAIVTGANGFVGSHIVYRLLDQGWHVHALGRSVATRQWSARVEAALGDVGSVTRFRGSLECHEVDFSEPDLHLNGLLRRGAMPSATILFHVAGDTRFAPPDPEMQRRMNVDSAVNVVKALNGRIATAVHISTTFVAGDRTGVIREDELDCGQDFRNCYERSKFDAEVALTEYCRAHDLPLIIARPSVVTNDRRTGRASTFTHLNALVEVVSRVHRYYRITDGEVVSQRIRLLADPAGSLNLAPVDSIVPLLLRVVASQDAPGKTFHLCHPAPEPNADLMDVMAEALQIRGKLALEFLAEIPRPMTRTEELILGALEQYMPYLNSRTQFDMSNVRSVVPECDAYFSPIDPPYIRKILESQRAAKAERVAQTRCQPVISHSPASSI